MRQVRLLLLGRLFTKRRHNIYLIIVLVVGDAMKTNGMWMGDVLDKAVRDGEISYQANRNAVESIDIFSEYNEGEQQLMVVLKGLDVFITDLEEFKDVADKVAKQATASATAR